MNRFKIFFPLMLRMAILPLVVLFIQCKGNKPPKEENPLARVYNNYLYASDLDGIGKGLSPEDSTTQAKMYIDKWIMDQLVLGVAVKNITEKEEQKIDRLVEAYRASLIIAEYEQSLIDRELDTVITPIQLAEYYTANKEQYISGVDWVRCYIIKAKRDLDGVEDLRRWFRSGSEADFEKVKQYCANKEADILFALEKDRWIKLDRVLVQLPERNLPAEYLKPDRTYDRSDDKFIYLYKTFEFKDKSQPAPLSQVQDEISRILMHQRRTAILENLRKSAFEKGKSSGSYEKF